MPSLLDLPAEIRLMIYNYLSRGAKLLYKPGMHDRSRRQLSEDDQPQEHIAPEAALLFVSKLIAEEYRGILLRNSSIDVSHIFEGGRWSRERVEFLETRVYPIVRHLRINWEVFGKHHYAAVYPLIINVQQLQTLQLDVVPDMKGTMGGYWANFLHKHGMTNMMRELIVENFHYTMLPYAEALQAWRELENPFEMITSFAVTCVMKTTEFKWKAKTDFKSRTILMTHVDSEGKVKKKRLNMLAPVFVPWLRPAQLM